MQPLPYVHLRRRMCGRWPLMFPLSWPTLGAFSLGRSGHMAWQSSSWERSCTHSPGFLKPSHRLLCRKIFWDPLHLLIFNLKIGHRLFRRRDIFHLLSFNLNFGYPVFFLLQELPKEHEEEHFMHCSTGPVQPWMPPFVPISAFPSHLFFFITGTAFFVLWSNVCFCGRASMAYKNMGMSSPPAWQNTSQQSAVIIILCAILQKVHWHSLRTRMHS